MKKMGCPETQREKFGDFQVVSAFALAAARGCYHATRWAEFRFEGGVL